MGIKFVLKLTNLCIMKALVVNRKYTIFVISADLVFLFNLHIKPSPPSFAPPSAEKSVSCKRHRLESNTLEMSVKPDMLVLFFPIFLQGLTILRLQGKPHGSHQTIDNVDIDGQLGLWTDILVNATGYWRTSL